MTEIAAMAAFVLIAPWIYCLLSTTWRERKGRNEYAMAL
jgi:hypothetical protein